jgi:hypothetical protein
MLATAVSLAVLVGLALGWTADRLLRRDPSSSRAFERDYAALVADTPIDWDELHGPGPGDPASGVRTQAALASQAERLGLRAKPLSPDDLEYYATSWRNIRGQFLRYPESALRLARHLTANLLVNRGLVPPDTARPSRLPEGWVFPTARGYRDALEIAAKAEATSEAAARRAAGGEPGARDESADPGTSRPPTDVELARALALFEDFYWEILALAPVTR